MTQDEHAAWTRRRKLGRLGYILRHGVLAKGTVFALIMLALQWFQVIGKGVAMTPQSWALRFLWLAALYGGVVGWLDWSSSESRWAEGPESDDLEPEITCLKCEAVIPANESRCQVCGWSFDDSMSSSEPPGNGDDESRG